METPLVKEHLFEHRQAVLVDPRHPLQVLVAGKGAPLLPDAHNVIGKLAVHVLSGGQGQQWQPSIQMVMQ